MGQIKTKMRKILPIKASMKLPLEEIRRLDHDHDFKCRFRSDVILITVRRKIDQLTWSNLVHRNHTNILIRSINFHNQDT